MRILVAPQEFKGSLTAKEAAEAIARGLRRALPEAELDLLPLADGGPGTVEVLVEATGGRFFQADAHDPLGRPLRARWGALGGRGEGTAVIEMAAASGLALLRPEEHDPRRASTFGTGELLRAALDAGYRRIIVGVGGSATNDGGAGLAQALGAHLLDARDRGLPPGGAALARLARIDVAGLDPRLREAEIVVVTDVTNPLCGPEGASLVYGPQKGASEAVARELDAALAHYAEVVRRDLGVDVAEVPGAGAAGGLAAALIAFCGAQVRPGFEVVAEAVGLAGRVRRADLVVTGEGRLDRQSAFGKTTAGVARAAREAGKPVVALVGSVEGGPQGEVARPFDAVFALTPDLAPPDEALARAAELLSAAAEAAGRWVSGGSKVH
ncbi:MAG: glycerate kinase [Chloroflexi bacterium RBG_16_68_14]|nr:MAG: glycerate kinase [Chloroflexi bacterium RBG_16_68_14]